MNGKYGTLYFVAVLVSNLTCLRAGEVGDESEGRTLLKVKSWFGCPTAKSRINFSKVGEVAVLSSPNYPFSYPNNLECRYIFSSPAGTRMKVSCDLWLPHQLLGCERKTGDSVFFSLNGDESSSQSGNNNYFKLCGRYWVKSESVGNRLVVGLRSGSFNFLSLFHPFKRFKCKVKVVKGKGTSSSSGGGTQGSTSVCGVAQGRSREERIIGGMMTAAGQFPWRCLLQVRDGMTVKKACTCSIISMMWILSAAHCTLNEDIKNVFIYVGETSVMGTTGGIPVTQLITNTKYGGLNSANDDTLLLKLEQPLTYSSTVAAICLPCKFKGQQFIENKVTVSGFVETGGTYTLMNKDLMVLNRAACAMLLPINNDEICIYEPGKTACVETGETGSYADYYDAATGLYYAAGIYSWDKLCTTEMMPSVHQNVARYLDWIETNTGEKFC